MALMKLVDGVEVEMSPEEEAAWLASLPPVSTVPSSVSRAQAKIALLRAGLLSQVEAAVSGEAAIWYADAANWLRDNPNVVSLGASLNLTSAQIDDLFRQAAQIEA